MNADSSQNISANLSSEGQPLQTPKQSSIEVPPSQIKEIIEKARALNKFLREKIVVKDCLRIPSTRTVFINSSGRIVMQDPDFNTYGWTEPDKVIPMIPPHEWYFDELDYEKVNSYLLSLKNFLESLELLSKEEDEILLQIAQATPHKAYKKKDRSSSVNVFYEFLTDGVYTSRLIDLIRAIRIYLKNSNDPQDLLLPDIDEQSGPLFKVLMNFTLKPGNSGFEIKDSTLSLGINDGLFYISKDNITKFAEAGDLIRIFNDRGLDARRNLGKISDRIIWDLIPKSSELLQFKDFLVSSRGWSGELSQVSLIHPSKES